MIKRKEFNLCVTDLKNKYKQEFPQLSLIAESCSDKAQFKELLRTYVLKQKQEENNKISDAAAEQLLLLIQNDSTVVDELSTGQQLEIETITLLWQFLSENLDETINTDLYLDLYHQFKLLHYPELNVPHADTLKRYVNRWPDGLDPAVLQIRKENKERIIEKLIRKIEQRTATTSRYLFESEMTYEEKKTQVEEWWDSSHFHLSMAIKSPGELNSFLDNSLSPETIELLHRARKKKMPLFRRTGRYIR